MTTLVLLILGAVWAAVLVPPALRARAEASPGDSIGHFHSQLNVLRRTGGYAPVPTRPSPRPVGMTPVPVVTVRPNDFSLSRKRRRDVLMTLLSFMGATLVLGLLPPFRSLLLLHLVADALFAGYVVLLLQMKKATQQRVRVPAARNVTELRPSHPGVTDLSLRRAAAGR